MKLLKLDQKANNNAPPNPDEEENPLPESTPWSYHSIVWKHFGRLLLDIPFPILLLFTLWRMPKCIYKLIKQVSFLHHYSISSSSI